MTEKLDPPTRTIAVLADQNAKGCRKILNALLDHLGLEVRDGLTLVPVDDDPMPPLVDEPVEEAIVYEHGKMICSKCGCRWHMGADQVTQKSG